MATLKPAVVVVPGAWLLSVAFEPIVKDFQAAGFPCEVVALPSVGGISDPISGIEDDVAAVRAVLATYLDRGTKVILLCHSYGGLVAGNAVHRLDLGTRAREGKAGGVQQIIFMSAFLVPLGKNLLDLLGGQPAPWMDLQGDKIGVKPDHVVGLGFNDLPPERAALASKQMSHSSASVFLAPSTFEPWASSNNIPCAYIFNNIDQAAPLPLQQQVASQLGPQANTVTLNAGHCPFLSIPDQVVQAVKKLAVA